MNKNLKRGLVGVVAASLMGLTVFSTLASAAPEPFSPLGRNAPASVSGSAKWTSSAQGETNGAVLRGRSAVQETSGVKRARIYRSSVQQYMGGGVWSDVLVNDTDVISDASRAYAVGYTPTRSFCQFRPELLRTYREVNSYGIRRSDNGVVNKTTYSSNFTARALLSDSGCTMPAEPKANLEIDIQGDTTQLHEENQTLVVRIANHGPGTAGNATAVVNFDNDLGLVVDSHDPRAQLRTSSSDPNDYLINLGVFASGESEEITFNVDGDIVGSTTVAAFVDGSVEPSPHDDDSLTVNVIPAADLSLYKSVDTGYIHSGDTVTYRFEVRNAGPDVAHGVTLTDNWPTELSPPSVTTPGNVCSFNTGADTLTCEFGDVAVGGVEVIYVTAPASSVSPTTVVNTATVSGNEADRDSADRTDSASFNIGVEAPVSPPADEAQVGPAPGQPAQDVPAKPVQSAKPEPQPEEQLAPQPQPELDPAPEPVEEVAS